MPYPQPDQKVVTTNHSDSFDHILVAAQELHEVIRSAAAKHGQAVKDHLAAVPQRAAELAETARTVVDVRTEITKKYLGELSRDFRATERQVAESLKSSGPAFHAAVANALVHSRSAVTKISWLIAARHTAVANQRNKREE